MYCSIFADFLSGDDSFGTFSLNNGCNEALRVITVELENEKVSARAFCTCMCLCVHCSSVYVFQ